MSEPITKEEREAVRRYQCDVFHCTTCDWLNGYEALVVDLECRLKIAVDELVRQVQYDGSRRASEALAAMAKEEK